MNLTNNDYINSCLDDLREQQKINCRQAIQHIKSIQDYLDDKHKEMSKISFEIDMAKQTKADAIKEYYYTHDTGLSNLNRNEVIRKLWVDVVANHKEPTEEQAALITYITTTLFDKDDHAKLKTIFDVNNSIQYEFQYEIRDLISLGVYIPNPQAINSDNYDKAVYELYIIEDHVQTLQIATLSFSELIDKVHEVILKARKEHNNHDN